MKQRNIALLIAGLIIAQPSFSADKPATDKDKLSYSLGHNVGTNLKQQQIDVNIDVLLQGLKDGATGTSTMKEEEIRETISNYQRERIAKQAEEQRKAGEENAKKGKAFLEENKKKEGVVALPSGLQYKVITEGKGKKPTDKDLVTTHYRGTLLNGTEFDSSYKRNEPATFPVNGVIAGWTEALQLMSEGSKWQLFIPAELAYGTRGGGGKIGPNETLVFEVELLAVKDAAEAAKEAGEKAEKAEKASEAAEGAKAAGEKK